MPVTRYTLPPSAIQVRSRAIGPFLVRATAAACTAGRPPILMRSASRERSASRLLLERRGARPPGRRPSRPAPARPPRARPGRPPRRRRVRSPSSIPPGSGRGSRAPGEGTATHRRRRRPRAARRAGPRAGEGSAPACRLARAALPRSRPCARSVVSATRRGSGGCVAKNDMARGASPCSASSRSSVWSERLIPAGIPARPRRHLLADAIGLLLLAPAVGREARARPRARRRRRRRSRAWGSRCRSRRRRAPSRWRAAPRVRPAAPSAALPRGRSRGRGRRPARPRRW